MHILISLAFLVAAISAQSVGSASSAVAQCAAKADLLPDCAVRHN